MMIFFRFALFLSVWVLLFAPAANGQSLKKALGDSQGQPIVIKSNTLEFDHQSKMVTFSGNVEAKRDDWTIASQKMVVYYGEKSKGAAQKENMKIEKIVDSTQQQSMKIEKIVAQGDVRITRQSGGLVTAQEATYYWDEERVVLTGKPVIQQGDDFVEGNVVTLLLKENRSLVEGSGDTRVRAVISPRSEKR
jgi:lipopolysaccharide export system protein LptA